MRAVRRLFVAPLVLAAAAAIAAGPAHLDSTAAHHAQVLAGPQCPAGSNWDNVLQRCV
ncbi:MAG TPA: hypothetical protein VMC03_06370 [Streptosporangiaceae bacterium]|nr:hypothetical protein [Streptosporangiaceae bacterium]